MISIVDNDISICQDKECHLLFYFTAKWCGPCQNIKPSIQKLSEDADTSILEIYMIDIDENEDMANEFQIRSVPTFHLYHKRELKGQVNGTNKAEIQGLINKIAD